METEDVVNTPEQKHVWERRIDLGDGSGVQVFTANSAEELVEKLAKAQEHATRKIRELNQRIKLGTDGKEPEKEKRFSFQPKRLTDDEAWQMGTQMSDPAKASHAVRQIIESEFGAPLEDVREAITRASEDARNMRAKAEAEAFVAGQPDYYPCQENLSVLTQYLERNGFSCTKRNLDIAFDDLNAAGLLKHKPIEATIPETPAPSSQPEVRIDTEANTRPRRTAATGLRTSDASPAVAAKGKGPSAIEIANMSAEEYKLKILIPSFSASKRNR